MISLLVPYRADAGSDRAVAWQFVRKWWERELPDAEIVVGIDSGDPFSKTTAVNDAYSRSAGDVLVVTDADAVIEPEVVLYGAYLARKHDSLVVPWNSSTRMTQRTTDLLLAGGVSLDQARKMRTDEKRPSPLSAGIMFIISRAGFETVNGMDPRFRGWGHEDVSFRVACDTLLGPTRFMKDGWVACLYHRRLRGPGGAPVWEGADDGGRSTRKLAQVYLNAVRRREVMRQVVAQHPLGSSAAPIDLSGSRTPPRATQDVVVREQIYVT